MIKVSIVAFLILSSILLVSVQAAGEKRKRGNLDTTGQSPSKKKRAASSTQDAPQSPNAIPLSPTDHQSRQQKDPLRSSATNMQLQIVPLSMEESLKIEPTVGLKLNNLATSKFVVIVKKFQSR
jgi:hypothetical protein